MWTCLCFLNPVFKSNILQFVYIEVTIPLFKQCYPRINFARNAAHHSEYDVDLKSLPESVVAAGNLAFDSINIKQLHTLT